MTSVNDLDTPALLLHLDPMARNLRRMADFFATVPATLRPHTKTHQCPPLARLQLAAGAKGICCASLAEAEVMLAARITDILVTREIVTPARIERAAILARDSALMVIVDDADVVERFSRAAVRAGASVRVLVDVDVRLGRSGVRPEEDARDLARRVHAAPGLRFMGLMGYEGSLHGLDPAERALECRTALERLVATRALIERDGIPMTVVSAGATSTYQLAATFPGVTEVQAGSYLTYDGKYTHLSTAFEPALSVLTTVVSRPTPTRVTTDAGQKAISSEGGLPQLRALDGLRVIALNEAHGLLERVDPALHVRVGDRIELIPAHGGVTINLYDRLYGIRGERVETVWPVAGRYAP